MPILNFRINKLEAERKVERVEAERVDVSSNFTILGIKQEKDELIGDYLRIRFRFDVSYKPDLGSLRVEGSLWYRSDELGKEVEAKEGRINLPKRVVEEISTTILQDCLIECIEVARKLRLPLPIRLPTVKVEQERVEFPIG